MAVRVRVDVSNLASKVSEILKRKVQVTELVDVRDEIAGEYAMYISKYVPYKTGKLLHSANIEDGAVVYSARTRRPGGTYDYAGIQYTVPFSPDSRSTPNTWDHWNKHLTTAERKDFYESVATILTERMNNE